MSVIIKILKRFLNENKGFFVISVLFFIAGVIAGSIFYVNLPSDGVGRISEYFEGIKDISVPDYKSGFILSASRYMFYAVFMWLCGLMYFGSVVSPMPLGLHGFATSFSVSALYNIYGWRGIMMAALTLIPGCVLLVPVMLVFSVYTMRRSLQFAVRIPNSGFMHYTLVCIFMSIIFLAGAIFDSFIVSYVMTNMF